MRRRDIVLLAKKISPHLFVHSGESVWLGMYDRWENMGTNPSKERVGTAAAILLLGGGSSGLSVEVVKRQNA